MLKSILGPALGGLVAGAIALVASAQSRAPESPFPAAHPVGSPYAMTVADTGGASAATTSAPTLVQCERQQEAVLRRTLVAGREIAEVTCVTRTDPREAYYGSSFQPPPVYESDIVTRPAVRTASARPARQVVYREATPARAQVEKKRSWKTTALVIGAGTGAGAGIGALAGGKKGAAIGAAIGGGGATVYEVIKRR